MSKITPKNLSYDDTLPPFLQRLRGQVTSSSSSDGRHERAIARPKRPRNAEDEAEDEPTVVMDGEVLGREEWKRLVGGNGNGDGGDEGEMDGERLNDDMKKENEETREREKRVEIGGGRKRKVGRVVGGDDEVEDGDQAVKAERERSRKDESLKAAVGKVASILGEEGEGSGQGSKGAKDEKKSPGEGKKGDKGKSKSKSKPKPKKVKLSFDDEEVGG